MQMAALRRDTSFFRRAGRFWPLCCRAVEHVDAHDRIRCARPRWPAPSLLAPLLLAIGSIGFAAAWVLVAFARNQQCSWMALLAAIDAVLLLRLGRMPRGIARSLLAVAGTVATIVLANWGIAAAQIGRVDGPAALGIDPQARPVLRVDAGQPRQSCERIAVAGRIGGAGGHRFPLRTSVGALSARHRAP